MHNAANPKYSLENDLGWVMVAKEYDEKTMKGKVADDFPRAERRKWYYDPLTSGITTDVMDIKAEITIFG